MLAFCGAMAGASWRVLTWRQLVGEELDVAAHKQAAVAVVVLRGHLQCAGRGGAAAGRHVRWRGLCTH